MADHILKLRSAWSCGQVMKSRRRFDHSPSSPKASHARGQQFLNVSIPSGRMVCPSISRNTFSVPRHVTFWVSSSIGIKLLGVEGTLMRFPNGAKGLNIARLPHDSK